MANLGTNFGQDITLTPGARCVTTTANWRWVCGTKGSVTSFRPDIPNSVTSIYHPVGIIQADHGGMSALSTAMRIRTTGISKVVCLSTVTAFDWVTVDGSTGAIVALSMTATINTVTTLLTANVAAVAGMVLESGVANQLVEMIVRPTVAGPHWA